MREMIFRGQRKDNGEWVEGDYFQNRYHKHFILDRKCYIEWVIIPETVGQYTGLTDKNGKRIFEFDILKLTSKAWSERNFECIVKFGEFKIYDLSENGTDGEPACKEDTALEGCIGWYLDCGDDDYYYQCMAINKDTFIQYDVEVISNIHEEDTK